MPLPMARCPMYESPLTLKFVASPYILASFSRLLHLDAEVTGTISKTRASHTLRANTSIPRPKKTGNRMKVPNQPFRY